MMIGFNAYQSYMAMSLHFNKSNDYNCFTYHFKTKSNEESFKKHKMKWQFAGLEKQYDLKQIRYFMFRAFERNDFTYMSPMMLFKLIFNLKQERDFITNKFKSDLQYLSSVYNGSTDLFHNDNLYPNIYMEYNSKKINIKTLILLHLYIKDVINTHTSRDIIAWPRFIEKVDSISPFIKYFYDKDQVEHAFLTYYLVK